MTTSKTITNDETLILGIDPGTQVMGFGILHVKNKKLSLIQFGVIHLKKYTTHELKLKKIYDKVSTLIEEFAPDIVALEAPFFGKNVQSMLKLGRAQGVAMSAALAREVPIVEYAPKKVKQSVTGNGNASKEQVAQMLKVLLKFEEAPKLMDATDALAVAVCHHFQGKTSSAMGTSSSKKGWGAFIKDNPNRIK